MIFNVMPASFSHYALKLVNPNNAKKQLAFRVGVQFIIQFIIYSQFILKLAFIFIHKLPGAVFLNPLKR